MVRKEQEVASPFEDSTKLIFRANSVLVKKSFKKKYLIRPSFCLKGENVVPYLFIFWSNYNYHYSLVCWYILSLFNNHNSQYRLSTLITVFGGSVWHDDHFCHNLAFPCSEVYLILGTARVEVDHPDDHLKSLEVLSDRLISHNCKKER